MMDVRKRLFELQDKEYAAFQLRLMPTVAEDRIIGVRVPQITGLAKELIKEDYRSFLVTLPHRYYDEDMLHGKVISQIKDYGECVREAERFLPYVDNWAVCDSMTPKVFKKHRPELLDKVMEWVHSEDTYTCRFGIRMAMDHYLDDDFNINCMESISQIRSEEYYINMMIAWYFATALTKRWNAAYPYIAGRCLDPWTHHKTIMKAGDSYRITYEQKRLLNRLK